MSESKMDRRIKYTRMVLRQSLLELLGERPIGKITVRDICERADINRSTFYAHFRDPYDLLAHIQDELYDSILNSLQRYDTVDATLSLLLEIVNAIAENRDLCKVLFSNHGDHAFIRRIMYIAHDQSIEAWMKRDTALAREKYEYIYAFVANGSVGIIQFWIQQGMKSPPADIAALIESLAYHGLAQYMSGTVPQQLFPSTH